jgi:hypothetical protein
VKSWADLTLKHLNAMAMARQEHEEFADLLAARKPEQ